MEILYAACKNIFLDRPLYMPVTFVECKSDETSRVLSQVGSHLKDRRFFSLFSLNRYYGGDSNRMIRDILHEAKSKDDTGLILFNMSAWLTSDKSPGVHPRDLDSDSSDDEDPANPSRQESSILFSLVSWLCLLTKRHSKEVYFLFDSAIPSEFTQLPVKIVKDLLTSNSDGNSPVSELILHTHVIPMTEHCVCIRGYGGSGKSELLFNLAKSLNSKAVWLHSHEIVNCELGETSRIIRQAFNKASGYRPSVVLMDDADLTLLTNGKIVKECIEELGNCISEFRQTFFIFSTRTELDSFIMKKVNRTIQL